jgi:hypothetical protein
LEKVSDNNSRINQEGLQWISISDQSRMIMQETICPN